MLAKVGRGEWQLKREWDQMAKDPKPSTGETLPRRPSHVPDRETLAKRRRIMKADISEWSPLVSTYHAFPSSSVYGLSLHEVDDDLRALGLRPPVPVPLPAAEVPTPPLPVQPVQPVQALLSTSSSAIGKMVDATPVSSSKPPTHSSMSMPAPQPLQSSLSQQMTRPQSSDGIPAISALVAPGSAPVPIPATAPPSSTTPANRPYKRATVTSSLRRQTSASRLPSAPVAPPPSAPLAPPHPTAPASNVSGAQAMQTRMPLKEHVQQASPMLSRPNDAPLSQHPLDPIDSTQAQNGQRIQPPVLHAAQPPFVDVSTKAGRLFMHGHVFKIDDRADLYDNGARFTVTLVSIGDAELIVQRTDGSKTRLPVAFLADGRVQLQPRPVLATA
ncbi:hypothetical protein BC831DRAFT_235727 [Entophlyctis helioformis]|nr:hypothetical protein BC831DRAFT_235727 [Entophlyctis helioformis]